MSDRISTSEAITVGEKIGKILSHGKNIPQYYVPQQKPDMVNHPPHYERKNAMECIDEMMAVYGPKAVAAFCVCNAWKYRYRAADKNGAEDIKKSDWYMHKYQEICNTYHITGADVIR